MKKILSILALLMIVIVNANANADEVVWDSVSTASEFYSKIENNHAANICITADIDLSSISPSGDFLFHFTFTGRITGERKGYFPYKLKNYSKTLFEGLEGATITHLVIADSNWGGRDINSGQLAETALSTTMKDVIFSGITGTGNHNLYDSDYMGVAVGTAENCTFTGLVFIGCTITSDGSYVGCVAGKAKNCTFTTCFVNGQCNLWADGNVFSGNSGYVGSMCGYADGCKFNKCVNLGLVSSDDDRIGGIIGFGTNGTTIYDCLNRGVVKHCTEEGFGRLVRQKASIVLGIVGSASIGLSLLSYVGYEYFSEAASSSYEELADDATVYSYGGSEDGSVAAAYLVTCTLSYFSSIATPLFAIIGAACITASYALSIYDMASSPDELGGIAGTLENGCIVARCTNSAPVECSNDYCGGIVGYLNASTIENCYNQHIIKGGTDNTGGIAGFCKNGTIKGCLNTGNASADGSRTGTIVGGTKGTCTISGNYYLSESNTTSSSATGFTQDKLPTGEVAKMLNDNLETKIWRQKLGEEFNPTLCDTTCAIVTATSDAYTSKYGLMQMIYTNEQFYQTVANPCAQISLQNDIDLDSYYFNLSTEAYPFKGKIYGHGHTISNCSYEAPTIANSDQYHSNAALFSFAQYATFDSLTLSNVYITQQTKSMSQTAQNIEAILVAQSNHCTYSNITLKNCSITRTGKSGDYLEIVGGIVAMSNNDTLTDCTVESSCKFHGYVGWGVLHDTNVGGIASKAYNSTFTRCANHASIWADDNQEGGIVAYASGCKIDRCLNTRGITAQENVGGICGNGYNTVITRCVNTAWISDDDNTREDKRAGIVGYLHGSGASISQCLNFGPINYADDDCGALEGCAKDGAKSAKNTNSFYYCGYNNGHVDNQYEYSDASIFRIAKINSGEFAYKSTIDQVEGADKWLYQDIDNNTFCTNYPVPIPAAGTVYSNILCDGTQSYSNNFSSTAAHTAVDDGFGVCSICGNVLKDNIPASITISDAAGLIKVSNAVNRGVDYSNTTITLANDIDLDGYSYTPIGLNSSTPFKGTFDGQGHRIKNMTLSYAQGGVGFFGNVSGANTVIKNLIIDSSCSVTSTSGGGVAGLIGDVKSTSGSTCNVTIENCGNEATVTGQQNAAGIIGGVYNNDNTQIKVYNTYNTGNINGSYESASMCGYARRNYSFVNCYNSGEVTGVSSSTNYFYRNDSKGTHLCENCYDIHKGQTNVISAEDVTNGTLCNKLNTNHGTYSSWAQNIESDTHPVFGDGSVTFSRSSADKWTTVVLPFDVTINNSDSYVFYNISAVSDTTLVLSRMSGTLSAGTPAIVYMDDTAKDSTNNYVLSLASSGNVSSTINNPAAVGGLTLTGVYKKTDITNLKGYKPEGEYFYNLAANDSAKTIYCEPYTAYLAGSLENNAEKLTILSDIITINDSTALISFANAVNKGTDYSKSIVILNNDIDMSGCEFTPIGSDTHPFKGIFNGNCHRIKNLTINGIVARTGFFGTVAGANTFIKNLIIDSSCSVTSSACGTAGVIGGLLSSYNTTCNVSIMNCGNEANITGVGNTAGVLGGVYANDASVLTINNCYNTGAISGTKESATICGYARKNFTILNSYNTGSLTGAESGKVFYRYASGGKQYVANCYDINGAQGDGVAQLSSDDAALGVLCQNLNAGNSSSSSSAKAKTARKKVTTNAFGEVELGNSVWAQNIATDTIPTFGEGGLTYTRKSAFRYGAIVLPFDITIDSSNPYDFYTLSIVSSGDTIVVRKITEGVLAAGTPAFLAMKEDAKNAQTGNFEMSVSPAPNANMTTTVDNSLSIGGLTLRGVFHATNVTNEIGYVAYSDSIVNISALAEKVGNIICPAFNAYISGSLSINPLSLTVLFDVGDDPNAINAITNSLGESEKQIFDLGGRKTASLQRGINIVKYGNGVARKVIIK